MCAGEMPSPLISARFPILRRKLLDVISFMMGEDPKGFISKHQGLSRRGKSAEQIAEEIRDLLEYDGKTKQRLKEAQIAREIDDIPF